jgi:hypothetical protein
MLKRFDLEFASEELGFKDSNLIFKKYVKGKGALEDVLSHLGLGNTSDPMISLWNQHLGLLAYSSNREMNQKFEAFRFLYKLQNFYARKFIKEKNIGVEASCWEKKLRILQSALANISPFNGKG